MAEVATAAEKEALRGDIEREYSTLRDEIEKQFVADKTALTSTYQQDLKDNEDARQAALRTAGLNPDGSDPQGRPAG